MSILTPSEIKQLCEKYTLTPSKKYGQNYLISESPIHKMIAAAGIKKGDRVYEVGPGFGVLTFELLKTGANIRAFEIEKKLQPYWETFLQEYANFEIVWGNVLAQWNTYIPEEKYPYTVVANLPYQITSEMLEVMLESVNPPKTIVCMVQREVADRIVAKPGEMSILAVSIQYFGKPRIVTTVSRGSFWPQPKVDSAVIAVTDIQLREKSKEFFRIVRIGFSHKRKYVLKNLSDGLLIDKEKMREIFSQADIDVQARAEQLSIEKWIQLAELLTP